MASSLAISVQRREPVLVGPAEPTPHEFKPLSDIDDQDGLRFEMPVIFFYDNNPSMGGLDPARVIRDALAKALVFYYPLAGRLREGLGRKLVVECTGEGVLFVEADANVTLKQFGDALPPASPCLEELIYEAEGSRGIVNCPLLMIQVTRLMCGGFVLAFRHNHTMYDATGLVQFMNAMAEMARGAPAPSVPPVWARELLKSRTPPRVTCVHHEYDVEPNTKKTTQVPQDDNNSMVHRSFFFGPREIAALRKRSPPHLRTCCSTFDLLTACLWRSRTIALEIDLEEEVRVVCVVNARAKFVPPLPAGYYGNALAFAAAVSTADELCHSPLGYALELVRKAKSHVTDEYMRSVADLMVLRGRPQIVVAHTYLVSDVTRAGLDEVDFGWGKAVYGGPGRGGVGIVPGFSSFYVRFRNKRGEDGIVVPMCLPGAAMERFVEEIGSMTVEPMKKQYDDTATFILSAL